MTKLRITFTDANGKTFHAIVIGYAAAAALATALSNSAAASDVFTEIERNGEWEPA
jgi:hypothetical protein